MTNKIKKIASFAYLAFAVFVVGGSLSVLAGNGFIRGGLTFLAFVSVAIVFTFGIILSLEKLSE